MPDFDGIVRVENAADQPTIVLDGETADVTIGGNGVHGNLAVNNGGGATRLAVDSATGTVTVRAADGDPVVTIDGAQGDIVVHRKIAGVNRELFRFDSSSAAIFVGGTGNAGDVIVRDTVDKQRIKLDGAQGDIWVKDANGNVLFHFDSHFAALYVGGTGNEGDVIVRDAANVERIKLDSGEGDIWVKDAKGNLLFHFDSQFAALYVGGTGNEGDVIVRDAGHKERIKLDGGEGDIWVKDAKGNLLFHFDSQFAALYLGGPGNEGDLIVRNDAGNQTIKLDGGLGDIILSNADAAEDFAVADPAAVAPGMVMVLTDDGTLEPCAAAYDRKVVGVVSGAGPYRPGLVFDRGETPAPDRLPVSMMGKVACRADASYGAIHVGDLLTTSPTPGCAMKAADPARAFGSIIGKALTPLDGGEGLVTMLISLQ